MKLSSKSRYGLEFLLDLAMNGGGGVPVTLKDVSSRKSLSEKYLWQVVSPLKAADMVSASPGVKGGYKLARSPREITLKSVVEAVEGASFQLGGDEDAAAGALSGTTATQAIWSEIGVKVAALLDSVTLQEIVRRETERVEQWAADFCI
ncbi:MAG: Rrf2 family transcriptional regulator [Kiritimatiellia bacterium]|nr:Rrf2 family transcriptional regulator [Kiritimatiellia bacterium]